MNYFELRGLLKTIREEEGSIIKSLLLFPVLVEWCELTKIYAAQNGLGVD